MELAPLHDGCAANHLPPSHITTQGRAKNDASSRTEEQEQQALARPHEALREELEVPAAIPPGQRM
jgi:hypothetical protein